MLSRIMVAIIGIPVLIWILYSGGIPLLIFTNIIVGMATYEFYNMAEIGGKKPYKVMGILGALAIPNILFLNQLGKIEIDNMFVFSMITVLLIGYRVLQNRVENSSGDLGVTLLGALYVSVLFSHVILISFLPNGGKWLLTAQIMVWVCDTFAYFTGLTIGRKIFKRGFSSISPKKSIEGAVGGVAGAAGLGAAYAAIIHAPVVEYAVICAVGALISMVGDLAASAIKRNRGIKDYGKMIPGHGGILDRFDSVIFTAPVIYYMAKFILGI